MTDTLLQPFRRNLDYDPIIIPIGLSGVATRVPPMTGGGVTAFKMANPNPFWVWYRGWQGTRETMPPIAEKGHFIAPGAVDICRTQMPDWIAAVGSAEPDFPLAPSGEPVIDQTGALTWNGRRCRLVMIYGSGV